VVIGIIIFAGLFFYYSSGIHAEGSDSQFRTSKPERVVDSIETPEPSESPEPSETPRVKGTDRLGNLRLKFCENHEDEIDNRLTSLGNLVAMMLGKFDAISARVQEFYTAKVVPSGKTVTNYALLISDIEAKRTAVETALANSHKDVADFSCTGENPKGQIRLFRTDMQLVKRALQDYRTSIKNLIVAIKSATSSPVPTAI